MQVCSTNTDYLPVSEVVVYVFVRSYLLLMLPFIQSDITSHVVRWLFFLLLPWWYSRRSLLRCSLPRPCALACAANCIWQQTPKECFGVPTVGDCTLSVCKWVWVCARVCLQKISTDTWVNKVTVEFLIQPLALCVLVSRLMCHY